MDVIKRYTAAQCWWSVVAFLTFEPRSQEGEVTYKKTKPKCGSRLPRDTPGSPIFLFFVSPPPPSSPFLLLLHLRHCYHFTNLHFSSDQNLEHLNIHGRRQVGSDSLNEEKRQQNQLEANRTRDRTR